MIGFLVLAVGIFLFIFFGYTLLTAPFNVFMNFAIISSFVGMIALVIYGGLWEWYFQKPAKTIIAHRGAAAWELAVDDLGYADLQPSKKYMPQGLVQWKFGWCLLPRPRMKTEFIEKLRRKIGRKSKDPEKEQKAEQRYYAQQQQQTELLRQEQELAEKLGMKKCTFKYMGKPLWFNYIGLASNYNPYVLVPSELKENQDNPHSYFSNITEYINDLTSLSSDVKKDLFKKLQDLENHIDHVRLVLDPRRFKEIHPTMYTQSQVDDHGRIHEQIGRESVTGVPMKYIIIVLAVIAIVGILGFLFFMFGPKQGAPNPQPSEQAAALIEHVRALL